MSSGLTSKVAREQDAIPEIVVDNSNLNVGHAMLSASVAVRAFRITDGEMTLGDGLLEDGYNGVTGCHRRDGLAREHEWG